MTMIDERSPARRRRGYATLAALSLPALAPATHAGLASALLREGDDLQPGEAISALNNTAVNHLGGYACSLNTTGADTISRIWGNASGGAGALLRSETTIGDLQQTSYESFYGMGDGGELAYGTTTTDLESGETGLDTVWLDDAVVLNELNAVPSLPGQFSTFNSRPTASGDGVPVWAGGIANAPGVATRTDACSAGSAPTS